MDRWIGAIEIIYFSPMRRIIALGWEIEPNNIEPNTLLFAVNELANYIRWLWLLNCNDLTIMYQSSMNAGRNPTIKLGKLFYVASFGTIFNLYKSIHSFKSYNFITNLLMKPFEVLSLPNSFVQLARHAVIPTPSLPPHLKKDSEKSTLFR